MIARYRAQRENSLLKAMIFFLLPAENSDHSLYGYCSVDGCPEFISVTNDEELPVRWKAPECLLQHCYSTASDVWAFGVLMYEVLTYGCLPYRHVLNDDKVVKRVSLKTGILVVRSNHALSITMQT